MSFRALGAVLTLLLFVAPLWAAICGSCISDSCAMPHGVSAMSESPAEASHGEAAMAQAPCHGPEEPQPAEKPSEPCHGDSATLAFSDCCSMSAAPEPEVVAAPAGPASFEIGLSRTPVAELLLTRPIRGDERRQLLRPPGDPPLYTLHSAFLI